MRALIPPANQGDVSRLRRCRPVLSAHDQADFSAPLAARRRHRAAAFCRDRYFGWGLRLPAGRAVVTQGPQARTSRGMNARLAVGALLAVLGIGAGAVVHFSRGTVESRQGVRVAAGRAASAPSARDVEAGPEVAGALQARKIPDRLPQFSLQDPSGKPTSIGSFARQVADHQLLGHLVCALPPRNPAAARPGMPYRPIAG